MAAITYSADGEYLFLALEDGSGNQIVARASKADLSTWAAVYEPGANGACNIMACVANPDRMFFYGYFGTSVCVIEHTISTGANVDISPGADDTVEVLQVNPDDEEQLVIALVTAQDIKYSEDGGNNWTDWNTSLGGDPLSLWVLWSGQYALNRFLMGANDGVNTEYLYSPNEGASLDDRASAGVTAAANICNVEATE